MVNARCSVMPDSLQLHGLYVACQAPLSMEFSRQDYWSGLPFPSPGGTWWMLGNYLPSELMHEQLRGTTDETHALWQVCENDGNVYALEFLQLL